MTIDPSGLLRPDGWSGDLRDMQMSYWREDSNVAAMVVVQANQAHGWINLRHCRPDQWALIWMRLRAAASRRPPLAIVWVDDLAALLLEEQPRRM